MINKTGDVLTGEELTLHRVKEVIGRRCWRVRIEEYGTCYEAFLYILGESIIVNQQVEGGFKLKYLNGKDEKGKATMIRKGISAVTFLEILDKRQKQYAIDAESGRLTSI